MSFRGNVQAVRRHPVTRALNPVTTGQAAKSNPTVTIVTLSAALVLLNTWKSQAVPDLSHVGKDALLALGLVAVGTVAPEVVTDVLWVALLLWVLSNEAAVADMIGRITSQVPGASPTP